MALVSLHQVARQFGTQIVLDGVSLSVNVGETVGLVGANGAGKTTLFRLIVGECEPDHGTVTRARNLQIGYLEQEPEIGLDRSLHDEVGRVFAPLLALERKLHELSDEMGQADGDHLAELMATYDKVNARFIAAGGHTFETRLNEILGGLGFSPSDHDRTMSVLSGGQKCRACLARLLLQDSTLLLLDEPTNHLDIDAVRWLEKFLAAHRGATVLVSHDRYLLDRLCDRVLELENRRVTSYAGNYSTFARTKEVQLLTQERQFTKDKAFIEKERDFITKHIAGQRTKEAQGRRTRLERRLRDGEFVTEAPSRRRTTKLAFRSGGGRGGTVLRCDELSMSFGSLDLFENLTFQVAAGDRLGITGPNGTGKSTLLHLIRGELTPRSGTAALDPKRTVGYYAQEAVALDPERTVLDEIRALRSDLSEEQARGLLGRYLFTGEDVFKPLGVLSGGEQSRVRLASLILSNPEILILDEPTNHLDIPSREALEEALTEFAGTIIVVSHDRYFIDRIVDRLLVLRPDHHALYAGNYSYYVEQVEGKKGSHAPGKKRSKKPTVRKPRAKDARTRNTSPYDALSVNEIEKRIIEREVELGGLHERFGDQAVCKDRDALAELTDEADELAAELEALNTAWLERADAE